MSLETRTHISNETRDMLKQLVQVNYDSRDGFRQVAEKVEEVAIANMFSELADQRDTNAAELARVLHNNGEEAPESGSMMASMHRTWVDFRTAIGGGLLAILQEAERGEDYIKERYEELLKSNPASPVSDLLHEQYAAVKAAHDRIRDMRDAMAEG